MADRAGDERLAALLAGVAPSDPRFARLAQVRQLTLARPAGSLGRLDDVVRRVAAVRRTSSPGPLPAIVSVIAADHGVAVHGTSAFPHGLTGRGLGLIADGNAPVNFLAAQVGARVESADFGLLDPVGAQRYRVAAGTRDLCRQDAMTRGQALQAITNGAHFADERLSDRPLLAVGEIGVGNTTAVAALASRLLGESPARMVGPGSGVGESVVRRKRELVEQALRRVEGSANDPLLLLAALGGLEIAGNVGIILAAAGRRQVVVIDGAITATAALVAVLMCPAVADHLIAAHCSTEPAHQALLDALDLRPLLRLDMRLGMTSGAALALGLVNSALAVSLLTPSAVSVGLGEPQ